MDFTNVTHHTIYAALELEDHPITLEVIRLADLYGDALAEGQEPHNLMSRPALPIEEVALEMVIAAAEDMGDDFYDD